VSDLEEKYKRITEKLQQLVKQHAFLQKENEKLKGDLLEKKSRLLAQEAEIDSLEQKVAVLKTVSGQLNEPDKKDLEKRLNLYLKEIDRCIGSLSD
jgi:predicted nuclease with TOPRIM domain